MRVHFFHTNDVHSHFEEYLQVATQLRRRREQATADGDVVFSFDIGDNADRKRMETEGTFGRTNAALLAQVGYDAWTFGNNEGLTLPKDSWADLVNESNTPLLVANLFDDESREPFGCFEPYVILERSGLRVAVIGLTVPFFDFYKMFGVWAEHPRDTFARLLPEIREQGVDLVVLLSHLGLGSDRQIAEEIEGIDLILGGHTHNVLEQPEQIGRTWIAQAGSHGSHLGHLTLEWDDAARRIAAVTGGAVPRDRSLVPDQDLADLLAHWQEHAAMRMTEVVAQLDQPLLHRLSGDSPLAHLVVDGMRARTGAQIAMINGGVFNHGLIEGPVTRADLLTCFPGPSITCVVELTGGQVLSLLEKSLDPAYAEQVGKGYGFRGYRVGGLQVSGLTVNVTRQTDGRTVIDARHDGKAIDPERVYEVAGIDYLYFSPVYAEFKEGRSVRFQLPFVRQLLGEVLAQTGEADIESPRWMFAGFEPHTDQEEQEEL
ncbi:bifunctional UDP-sugar hydrolase/5'-nucleotidase [Tumebacillus sp. DT12]|uniref:Bifunctional UDP-sugar hydrolase/5'-nucleotidase n=1 Tax=Tumebacillus lacus TaxID=2995335 RepID=A0ABT3X134_9BACL|nr:bifunctional UDP-sugar hydrolase/5'-nucleotidase [Tumebacillus lacus]MCX7570599.1 bifunctional UDP-sugar hydrolase/5'-nucleotidase [Tumebacillus lacus]